MQQAKNKSMKDNLNQSDDNRKLLSVLSHGSILFGSSVITIGVPIAILLLSEDSIVKQNAKEALNFLITCYILAAICIVLIVSVGIRLFFLLFLLLMASWVMPIIAMVKISQNPDRCYRYPIVWRLL